jgi:hypothetical protein
MTNEEEDKSSATAVVVLNYLRKYGLVDAANELQTQMSSKNDNDGAMTTNTAEGTRGRTGTETMRGNANAMETTTTMAIVQRT